MNNTSHLNLITAAFNRPLALEAGYARTFFSALSQRLGNVQQLVDIEGNVLRAADMKKEASSFSPRRSTERSYQVVNGIAVIPIDGSLVHKYGYIKPYSGMTGYDGIMYRLREALADPEVKAVMLDMNTPGGMVAGCFDLADKIAEYRKIKPIWSLGYDMHCSAGQMVASACSHRLITQTGVAGSVGVIMAHTNIEKMLDQQGVEITLITAGSHKADGNPYQALPKDVREKWQKELESNRQMFASKAAAYMGVDVKKVLATEAETYEVRPQWTLASPMKSSMAWMRFRLCLNTSSVNQPSSIWEPLCRSNIQHTKTQLKDHQRMLTPPPLRLKHQTWKIP